MMSFAESYYDNGNIDMDLLVPRLPVKFHEDALCFKGRKIPYEDFAKMVKRDDSYHAVVSLMGKPNPDEPIVDFAPLLNVGIAEFISILSQGLNTVDLQYLGWLQELEVVDDWFTMLQKVSNFLDAPTLEMEQFMLLSETLKSSLIDYRFVTVRRIYAMLEALRLLCPKSYCEAVIEGMKLAYSLISMCLEPICTLKPSSDSMDSVEALAYKRVVTDRLYRHGVVEYTTENGSVRKISDGRGLGMSALAIFMADVYTRYGEHGRTVNLIPIKKPESRKHAVEMFERCIGDDYVGRSLRKGKFVPQHWDKVMGKMGSKANLVAVDCPTMSYGDEVKYGRGMHEAHLLWRYACGVDEMRNVGVIPPVDCMYGTRIDFAHVCLDFCMSERDICMTRDYLGKYKDELAEQVFAGLDFEAMTESYRRDAESRVAEMASNAHRMLMEREDKISQLTVDAEDLQRQLSEKSDIISDLRSEVRELKSKVRSMYSEESEDVEPGVVETIISVDEMVAFINQFRLVMVGGFDTMASRMENLGLNNFHFITNVNSSNSTLASGDFFCICTRFVSHKLSYMVEGAYSSQLDQFFYYNGTNVEQFIRVCYEFMKRWFESDNAEPVAE